MRLQAGCWVNQAAHKGFTKMTRTIALLRGINVGGRNKLPMADLKAHCSKLGATDIESYIQSGNVVFSIPEIDPITFSNDLSKAIEASHGFAPAILVITARDLEKAIRHCPFPKDDISEKILHFYFLSDTPAELDANKLDDLKVSSEQWALKGKVFYLYAPDGFGRSKLAAKAETILGVRATVRNWRTVTKLQAML